MLSRRNLELHTRQNLDLQTRRNLELHTRQHPAPPPSASGGDAGSASPPSASGGDATIPAGWRVAAANAPARNAHYVTNRIVTSHYTWWSFAPLFLFQSFQRVANIYYLCVVALQAIPATTITGGVPTAAFPLAIVLTLDAVVLGLEDLERHKADARTNGAPTLALRGGVFAPTPSSEVRVGDVLKLARNAVVPADCVLLGATVHGDGADACYVQTASLDGETNLKLKVAAPAAAARFRTDAACAAFRGGVACEAPTAGFEQFAGSLLQEGGDGGGGGVALDADQLLLRGCVLRNVDSAYALVVYTGAETKARVRQVARLRAKVAATEEALNRLILVLIVSLVVLCVIGVAGYAVDTVMLYDTAWYFGSLDKPLSSPKIALQVRTA